MEASSPLLLPSEEHLRQSLDILVDTEETAARLLSTSSSTAEDVAAVESLAASHSRLATDTLLQPGSLSSEDWNLLLCRARHTAEAVSGYAREAHLRSSAELLQEAADQLSFVFDLGERLRSGETSLLGRGSSINVASAGSETQRHLRSIARLYQPVLRVIHDWDLLQENHRSITCQVEVTDVEATADWAAPWYVTREDSSTVRPVNVLGGRLEEAAEYDHIVSTPELPTWPQPLRHAAIPQGMRSSHINALARSLRSGSEYTVIILAYDLAPTDGGTPPVRVVLDGNHRLAAAHQVAGSNPEVAGRVISFILRESEPVDAVRSYSGPGEFPDWKGFSPDIGVIRGDGTRS